MLSRIKRKDLLLGCLALLLGSLMLAAGYCWGRNSLDAHERLFVQARHQRSAIEALLREPVTDKANDERLTAELLELLSYWGDPDFADALRRMPPELQDRAYDALLFEFAESATWIDPQVQARRQLYPQVTDLVLEHIGQVNHENSP